MTTENHPEGFLPKPTDSRLTTSRLNMEPAVRRVLAAVPGIDVVHLVLLPFKYLQKLAQEMERIGSITHSFFFDYCYEISEDANPDEIAGELPNILSRLNYNEYYLVPETIAKNLVGQIIERKKPQVDQEQTLIWKQASALAPGIGDKRLLGSLSPYIDATHLLVLSKEQIQHLMDELQLVGLLAKRLFIEICLIIKRDEGVTVTEGAVRELGSYIDLQDFSRITRPQVFKLLKAPPDQRWRMGLEIQGVDASILETLSPHECQDLTAKVVVIRHTKGEKFDITSLTYEDLIDLYNEIDSNTSDERQLPIPV